MAVATDDRPAGRPSGGTAGFLSWWAAGNLANGITFARLLAAAPIAWFAAAGRFDMAFWIFVVAGASDALDGFIAKRFGRRTRFGAWLDPLADKALLVGVFLALFQVGLLPGWLIGLVLARDVLLVAGALVLIRVGAGDRVRPSLLGKLNTVLQVALAGAVLGQAAQVAPLGELARTLVPAVALSTVGSGLGYAVGALRALARPERAA